MSTIKKPSKAELLKDLYSIYGKVSVKNCYEFIEDLEFEINLLWEDIYRGSDPESTNQIIRENKACINELYALIETLKTPEEYSFSTN